MINFLKKNRLEINLNLIHDESDIDFNNELKDLLKNDKFNIKFITSKIKDNHGSYLECCDSCETAEDLIFFIEDDYLFKENAIEELLISYSRLSTLLEKDLIFMSNRLSILL